jgi:predicted RNA-binding Zn-ribbon protein involved in translation (DUF1610 family)
MIQEYCSRCEQEVTIKAGFVKQECPSCGNPILPCSLCDKNEINCNKCLMVDA